MLAFNNSKLCSLSLGALTSDYKLFLGSGSASSNGKNSSLPRGSTNTNANAAGKLRLARRREAATAFGTKCRRASYYVEEPGIGVGSEDSPWEGAIIYKRSASQIHLEYCTTLERLGLSKVSSEVSRSTASAMGIGVTRAVTDYPSGTPIHLSIDVTRKRHGDVLLHGLIRTFISVLCYRCVDQAAKRVFTNFCLLLRKKPLKDPDHMSTRIDLGIDKVMAGNINNEEEEEGSDIDLDDQMYFPLEEKQIDISKYIRDIVHLEITIDGVCDPNCKGMCLNCGTNLNRSTCKCRAVNEVILEPPLQKLKKKMQRH